MDVNSLALFAHIVEGGSLSAAARALDMTRSNVSRRLKVLEDSIDAPLLIRTTHEITLTAAGELLYARARNILREAEAAGSELCQLEGRKLGRVKVVLPRSLADAGLAEVIAQFGVEHPDVTLEVFHANGTNDLHSSRTDIAIHISHRSIETAVTLYSSHVEWVVFGSASYLDQHGLIVKPENLYNHPIICYAERKGKVPFWTQKNGYPGTLTRLMLNPHIITNDLKFVLVAASEGAGIGLMPRFIYNQNAESEMMEECLAEYQFSYMHAKAYLQVMEARYQTPIARSLANRLKAIMSSFAYTSVAEYNGLRKQRQLA